MPELLEPIGLPDESRPYLPLVPAVLKGVVDLASLIPEKIEENLGVLFARGRIPGADNAGLISVGGSDIGCDHVAVLGGDKTKLEIAPTSKDDVYSDGVVGNVGAIMVSRFTDSIGVFRLTARVVDYVSNPWLADRLGAVKTSGRLAVATFGLEAAEYEIVDIDNASGIITAKPRR